MFVVKYLSVSVWDAPQTGIHLRQNTQFHEKGLLKMRDWDPQDAANARWIGGFLKWLFFLSLALIAISFACSLT